MSVPVVIALLAVVLTSLAGAALVFSLWMGDRLQERWDRWQLRKQQKS